MTVDRFDIDPVQEDKRLEDWKSVWHMYVASNEFAAFEGDEINSEFCNPTHSIQSKICYNFKH